MSVNITSVMTALYSWLSSFNLPVYAEGAIPDNAELPYITYTPICGDWQDHNALIINVYYKTSSFTIINAKANEIISSVGNGKILLAGNGKAIINTSTPLLQYPPQEDINRKQAYLLFDLQTIFS